MNPVPLLIVVFLTLGFESIFLGAQVQQSVSPFFVHVDTSSEECGDLAVGCAIGNFFRPFITGAETVINFLIYLGGLATFQIPGTPAWLQSMLGSSVAIALIWSLVELLRGKGS